VDGRNTSEVLGGKANDTEGDLIDNWRSFHHKRDHPGHSSMSNMPGAPQLGFF
jgi:hypothetical protein